MPSIKRFIARKAVKSTAKHTAHGTAAKLRRDPLRTTTLLGIGCVAGGVAGWTLARTAGGGDSAAAGGSA